MAKKCSPVIDLAVYLLVRVLVCVVQALSWDSALGLARGLAWLFYRVNRRHRLVALDNLRHAFADFDETALDRLVRASYLHLTTMLIEMIRLPRVIHKHNLYDYVHHTGADDLERIRRLVATGRPRLVAQGHFGNWEVLGYTIGLAGFRGAVVARRLDNPYLDRFLAGFRRKTGLALLDKSADYAKILEMLAQGVGLGMLVDQDAGSRGLFVKFFGRPASTFKSIALLALEYQAPIIVVGAARVGSPSKYAVYLEDIIMPEDYADRPDAAKAITQRFTDALERMVRRHPEQYFWLHRRWKTPAPQRRAPKAAA